MKIKFGAKSNLIIAPTIFIFLDAAFTLYFQPKEYWNDYRNNIEWSPMFKGLLEISPIVFFIGVLLYVAIFISVIHNIKKNISFPISFCVTFLHSNAILIWLINKNIISYYEFILILISISLVIVFNFFLINSNN